MINIIAAVAKNGVIGLNGTIPWNIPEDKKYFKKVTDGKIIIMGRKTFEGIGFSLPNRVNIIISKEKYFHDKNQYIAKNLNEAIVIANKYIKKNKISDEIFICGGANIYKKGLKYAQKIYLTQLDDNYAGDTYFPKFSNHDFKLIKYIRRDDLRLSFCVYKKRCL